MQLTPIALIIIAGILIGGCIAEKIVPSPPKSNDGTYASEDTLSALIAGYEIATLDTTHQITNLSLDPGPYVIAIQVHDAVEMMIKLNRVEADALVKSEDYGIFHSIGPCNGSVKVVAPEKGEYQLLAVTPPAVNVGEKKWTAQVALLPVDTSLKAPIHLSGTGSMVSPGFSLDQGEYIFERDEILRDSPLFTLSYANGSILGDQNGTFQPYFGGNDVDSLKPFTFVTIPETGTYYLIADYPDNPHNWTASIVPFPKVPFHYNF